jgi:hypothetical protein
MELFSRDPFKITRAEECLDRVVIRWAMGAAIPTDVIRTTFAAPIVVHQRVIDILLAAKFSGWSTYPVEVCTKDGEILTDYKGLSITGRCGPIQNERSTKIDRILPGGIFPVWLGLYFDPATWDGSDVFMPAGKTGWIFVSAEVKGAFERAKVKNIVFTPSERIERLKI